MGSPSAANTLIDAVRTAGDDFAPAACSRRAGGRRGAHGGTRLLEGLETGELRASRGQSHTTLARRGLRIRVGCDLACTTTTTVTGPRGRLARYRRQLRTRRITLRIR